MADKELSVMKKDKDMEREIESWSPFRLFPAGGFFEDLFAPLRVSVPALPSAWMPRADIRETDKEYILDLALPGVKKEDVKVEVKDEVLTITGEKKTEKEEKGKTWLRRESSYGSFQRSFALPEGLHAEDIKSSYKDGVLTLTMRKPAEVKGRGVSIKVD